VSTEPDSSLAVPARLIHPARGPLRGSIELPGSKSLTQRAMVLAALAQGRSTIANALEADDPRHLAAALGGLGVAIEHGDAGLLTIEGTGGVFDGGVRLDLGEGATGARFSLALATLAAAPVVVDGGSRLRERPMEEGVAMLRSLGASLRELAAPGRLPIEVQGGGLLGGSIEAGRTASSQFLSAVLLAAPATQQGVDLQLQLDRGESPTSASYLWLTIEALREAGVRVELDRELPRAGSDSAGPSRIRIEPQPIRSRTWAIEPDASTAIFFAVAAAIVPGSTIELVGLPIESSQPDAEAIRRMRSFGVELAQGDRGILVRGAARLVGADLDASPFPDAVPALAVLASRAETPTMLRGLETLRIKESDRIESVAENLRRAGAMVETGPDWLRVEPGGGVQGSPCLVDTCRDHRIAMAFAMLGLARPGVAIAEPEVVAKSDPGFWTRLERLGDGQVTG
jgi:3-phosphoshikimate 1-carboxyvinyltransferase